MAKQQANFTPQFEGQKCSLGYDVIDWLETYACHGPGDVQGEPLFFEPERAQFIIDAYELDPVTGKRLITEAVLSAPKGWAKSELAGLLIIAEAFAPVRFSHWKDGQPVGRTVTYPVIKCLATEEDQAGNTFQVAVWVAGVWGLEHHPDIYGTKSLFRNWETSTQFTLPYGGTIEAATSADASKDGGKETFVVADESHLMKTRRLISTFNTVKRNLGKRGIAEPWLLQTSTACQPGENSIFEQTMKRATVGPVASLLVDHREGAGLIKIGDRKHTMGQLAQAYKGAEFVDLERIYAEMLDPTSCPDEETAARYYLNRSISSKNVFFAAEVIDRQTTDDLLQEREEVALGFDGSLNDDSTVLIASRISDGYSFPIGIWSKPPGPAGNFWEVPRLEVLDTIRLAFSVYKVTRCYMDPHEWRSDIDRLSLEYPGRIVHFATNAYKAMGAALERIRTDLINGDVYLARDEEFLQQLKNAQTYAKGLYMLVRKPRPEVKIDSAVGLALAYQARVDTLAERSLKKKGKRASTTTYSWS